MRDQHAFNLFVPFFILMFRLVYKKIFKLFEYQNYSFFFCLQILTSENHASTCSSAYFSSQMFPFQG